MLESTLQPKGSDTECRHQHQTIDLTQSCHWHERWNNLTPTIQTPKLQNSHTMPTSSMPRNLPQIQTPTLQNKRSYTHKTDLPMLMLTLYAKVCNTQQRRQHCGTRGPTNTTLTSTLQATESHNAGTTGHRMHTVLTSTFPQKHSLQNKYKPRRRILNLIDFARKEHGWEGSIY